MPLSLSSKNKEQYSVAAGAVVGEGVVALNNDSNELLTNTHI